MDLHLQVKNLAQDIYKAAVQAESLVKMISLGNDSQTSDQYDPDEDNYMKEASGSFSDGNSLATAPSKTIKQQRICSNVYEYFENTSNLNKHLAKCAGWLTAWEGNSPGSIDPNLGAKLAAEEQGTLQKSLVETIVAIQLLFYVFETYPPKNRPHHMDQITLETQDTSSALSIISTGPINPNTSGIPNEHGGWPATHG
ncbi:hypothetical protein O181_027254 [Austropuccinia psidii MF-1]|uniref:Uncharacterized protein n=1 Tax=Austropuccinia psidii MF-1 TaxID=1389203 RepID=A0A9Q3H2F5_9BASI|nr:hypothetical protein [Austropuccinia psidii MF-1]